MPVVRWTGRLLLSRPFTSARRRQLLDATPLSMGRVFQIILHRLAFAPIVLAILVTLMVYGGTHPPPVTPAINPASAEVYYQPITIVTEDDTRLNGYLFPLLDEQRVLAEKEKLLTRKHPAVILVHHQAQSAEELCSLIRPLHRAGMVVLIVALRGTDPSPPAAQTFGLREAMDVKAAVAMLQRRPFIDPARIGIVATGGGATAALLGGGESAAAMVLRDPIDSSEQILTRIGPQHASLSSLRPLCRWVFEMVFSVDADGLDTLNAARLDRRANLLRLESHAAFDTTGTGIAITDFLTDRLTSDAPNTR